MAVTVDPSWLTEIALTVGLVGVWIVVFHEFAHTIDCSPRSKAGYEAHADRVAGRLLQETGYFRRGDGVLLWWLLPHCSWPECFHGPPAVRAHRFLRGWDEGELSTPLWHLL